MLRLGPDVVILCLGGNDISTSEQPCRIRWYIVELCRLIKARGFATVVVADICKWWSFRDAALTSRCFAAMGSSIAYYVASISQWLPWFMYGRLGIGAMKGYI
ncbi:hypothetical protein DPMN_013249 [Dreissena polymorpha]|uniref:Uncharacterized protein n=1 Tax=Dreissena polymorpha TaxID=45954 RepID=A0A9D4S3L6_DREPO|nr:hypothetical protein DPMN_013249 [Dreissena polymorpha]